VVSSGGSDAGADAPGDGPTNQSAGCGTTSTITSDQYNNGTPISITVNGKQRRYILNVPTSYDKTIPYKLILAFHSQNGNDIQTYNEKYYRLLPVPNDTAIFVAPNGTRSSGTDAGPIGEPCSGTGSGDSQCGWPYVGGDNIAFVDAIVAQIEQNFCVDTNRIFATGWSFGASMSYEVGCERPLGGTSATWGVRAIAIYSGSQMSGGCNPSTPVAYYASHGFHDSVLPYGSAGSDGGVSTGGLGLCQKFAAANGCTWAVPTKADAGGPHVCTHEADCKTGYPVEFCSFDGDHTAYPDNGQSATSWGPAEVWNFFSQF
jgi:poly(3-hydroxybutyrate) depolymerase